MTAAAENSVSVKWQKDGVDIDGATSTTYTESNVDLADAGSYVAIFTGSSGETATTNAAIVTVANTKPPVTSVVIQGAKRRYVKKGDAIIAEVKVSPAGADQSVVPQSGSPLIIEAKVV